MLRRTVSILLIATAVGAALGMPATAADVCPDPADSAFIPAWDIPYPETHGRDPDRLAISPGYHEFRIGRALSICNPDLTISRPDGGEAHIVDLNEIIDGAGIGSWIVGTETLDYATGTGPWRIAKATSDSETVSLTNPVDYRVRRASTVTLSVAPVTLPARPRATGVVRYWTKDGVQAPSPGRTVVIRKPDRSLDATHWVAGDTIARTTTDAQGRYSVTLPIGKTQPVIADVPATQTLGYVFTPFPAPVTATVYQPTSLTGRAAPTTATVIRSGTTMSTYGHLSVVYTTGRTGGFPGQKVLVQTRPRSNPSAPYTTVATAVTTKTGYYYANWKASVDADVRVAFVSPYKYIRSSFLWLTRLDVR